MRRAVAIVLGGLLALLIAAQLFLPGVAERRLRDDLRKYGPSADVSVSAFPAVKLLWGHADSVRVTMPESHPGQGSLADLLARTRAAGKVDATVVALHVGPLTLHDARFRKRGNALYGSAVVSEAELRSSLPANISVDSINAGAGGLAIDASIAVLGTRLQGRLDVRVQSGAVVVAPELIPFASLTVFSDKRVAVESIGAAPAAGGFTVTGKARLR